MLDVFASEIFASTDTTLPGGVMSTNVDAVQVELAAEQVAGLDGTDAHTTSSTSSSSTSRTKTAPSSLGAYQRVSLRALAGRSRH
jgi:hypothetical protein